jgi:hypothetical protein
METQNSTPATAIPEVASTEVTPTPEAPEAIAKPKDSYVKLAMRNMVRKRGQSLRHFAMTTIGLVGLLIGLAYLTR